MQLTLTERKCIESGLNSSNSLRTIARQVERAVSTVSREIRRNAQPDLSVPYSYYYWLRIIREEALCEAENRSGALVRVEPEKLAVETVSLQPSSGRIVIRSHGVEAEFPSGTDIAILAAFVKAIGHA